MTDISALSSGKRPRDDIDLPQKENVASNPIVSGGKKRRIVSDSLLLSKQAPPPQPTGPDPYRTIPPPTHEWIQLRFQLNRFKGVYRIVQVPVNYTFANLHTLVQYLFGWNGIHTHKTRVYTNVEMYKSANREGCIKSYGQAPEYPEGWVIPTLSEELQEQTLSWWNISNSEAAIYEVVASGKNQGKLKNSRGYFLDYSWHYKVEDPELTLGDVWNIDEEKNVSKGEYTNHHVGLIYEYELNCPWSVHITIDDGFYRSECPGNDVFIVSAKGAPSVEEKHHWSSDHTEGCKKAVSDMLLLSSTWKRYCRKEINTRTLGTELVVTVLKIGNMTDEQVKAKQTKLDAQADSIRKMRDQKEIERKRQVRAQRKLEREAEQRRALEESDSEPEYASDLC
ncbi:hypothetical protein BDZ97DRAFT_1915685 [Flammula alnicola]|nr:hypothetical protein BDZ97DRAFT_1915685 [Flammula alnicola]